MKNDRHIDGCDLGIEMMAYIYGELAEADKSQIDLHLAECGSCTDAFAEMSMSRFSVYEWKRDEFDPIETPSFVIPFEPAVETAGWFDGVRGLLAGWRPAAAFAAVATIFIGVGLFALTDIGRTGEMVSIPNVDVKETAPVPQVEVTGPLSDKPEGSTVKVGSNDRAPVRRFVRAKASVKKNDRINNGSTRALNLAEQQEPNLSNFTDEEDTTLRLSDLVDEGGI